MSDIVVAAIVGAVAGIITGLITAVAARPKTNADAAKAVSEAVANVLDPLNDRIEDQEKQLKRQGGRIDALQGMVGQLLGGIKQLINQIECDGKVPVWRPPEEFEQLQAKPPRRNGRSA
jgi:hypothetical protein